MYEDRTYDFLLQRSLDRCTDSVDKREGSIIFNGISMAAYEIAQMYIELDCLIQESYADTASREFLIRRANERGIVPRSATSAIVKGEFNIAVPIGSRFLCDSLNYEVIEVIDDSLHTYKLKCETSGTIGNSNFGSLIPISYIQGLTKAELTEVIIPGENEEDTEQLRKEYFESYDSQAFGGNRADYKKLFREKIQGIGGIKLERAPNGGGTVKIICIDSAFSKPSDGLINKIQQEIDPQDNQGEGLGHAPIGHVVTIVAVDKENINISANITYKSGWNFDRCKAGIETAIDNYFLELNKTWADSDNIIIRKSHLETRLLSVEGILDISNTTLNNSSQNVVLNSNSIAARGSLSG